MFLLAAIYLLVLLTLSLCAAAFVTAAAVPNSERLV
jgi:hypothetical protein